MDSCKSLVKRKHGSKTPSKCCHVALKISVRGASLNHQLEVKTSLRPSTQGPPIGSFHQGRSPEGLCHLPSLVFSREKGQEQPRQRPFPLAALCVSKASPASVSVGRSSIWSLAERGNFLWGSATLSLQLSIRCSLKRTCLTLWMVLVCFMESERLFRCSSASLKGSERKNVVCSATTSHLSVQQVTRCDKFMR